MLALAVPALGGPPYQTDDPEPTDYKHFEIYFFDAGTATRSGSGQLAGIDFNYGVAPEFQLDVVVPAGFGDAGVVLPVGFGNAVQGQNAITLGNVQLALKYRFLHQRDLGLDVAFYPRVFLPAGPGNSGENPSLFLPMCWRRISARGPHSAAADIKSTAAETTRTTTSSDGRSRGQCCPVFESVQKSITSRPILAGDSLVLQSMAASPTI